MGGTQGIHGACSLDIPHISEEKKPETFLLCIHLM